MPRNNLKLLADLAQFTFLVIFAAHLFALVHPLSRALTISVIAFGPAIALCLAALLPVFSNPVNTIFSLIGILSIIVLTFVTSGGEYSGFVVMIVQMGGVSILFLFVLISLNLHGGSKRSAIDWKQALGFYLLPLLFIVSQLRISFYQLALRSSETAIQEYAATDIVSIAKCLYGELSLLLVLAGLLLLTAMLGAIVLAMSTLEKDN